MRVLGVQNIGGRLPATLLDPCLTVPRSFYLHLCPSQYRILASAVTVFAMRLQLARSRAEGDFGGLDEGPSPEQVRKAKRSCYAADPKVLSAIKSAGAYM
jgi:hypothetical protein